MDEKTDRAADLPKSTGDDRPLILHISSDYLDPIRPPPITDAVVRLVDRMTDHPQIVVSLQRVSNPLRVQWRDFGEIDGRRLLVYRYFAPPFGIAMFASQTLVARRIRTFLAAEGITPQVIHTHRFTFEGIAGWLLAKRSGARLFCTARGEVESKVFRMKPFYRPLFRRMARDAERIYQVSAWFRQDFTRVTGVTADKTRLLPNTVFNARARIPVRKPAPKIIAVMALQARYKKGLPDLLSGFAYAGKELEGIELEIIGRGTAKEQEDVRAMIRRNGLETRAVLRDFMDHDALLDHLSRAIGLAMPSRVETFGMVYLEALFAGAPILYTAGVGVDGYIDDLPVGVRVRMKNVRAIASGLIALVRDNKQLRAAIRDNGETLFARFDPDQVIARYRADIAVTSE